MSGGTELGLALSAGRAASRAQSEAGAPLSEVLEALLLTAEIAAGGGMIASVLLVDESGRRLRHGAAPNLPSIYCAAIDGIEIARGVGSCGTAAFLGHPVYVTDIERDPLWADFRDLALKYGLRACWSRPFTDPSGAVIGTFAIYHQSPRSPTPAEVEAVALISDAVQEAVVEHARLTNNALAKRRSEHKSFSPRDDGDGA